MTDDPNGELIAECRRTFGDDAAEQLRAMLHRTAVAEPAAGHASTRLHRIVYGTPARREGGGQ